MANANDVQNAFARIAGELQKKQKQPTITPYEQSALSINTGGSNYQYRNSFDDANQVRDKYNAAIDTRDVWEQGLNVPRRIAGAFGELVESTAAGVANTAGAINRIGLDDQSQTAFIKLQDQKKNPEYQQELAELRNNPMGLIRTGARIDMRDVNERIKFLENRLNQNQLTEQEYSSLYNPDGTETEAKQRLNWSQAAADNGEYLAGDRAKGKTGFLNAGNWYGHEGEKAYQGYKALHGTSDQENRKLTRDAQDAYDKGDYLTWAKNQGKAFLNSASESAEALKANPMYAVEEAAAMAPYIVPYTRGLALTADAARVQNQSHDQFTDRELRTPTATETLGITAMTGAYTAANYAEAMLARGALRNEGLTKSLGLKSKVAPAVEQSAKASVLGSVTGNAGVQAFGRLASGMAGEGVTEAVQQQIESNWGSLDPTLDAQGMGESFTMGAAIHGVLSGPGAAAQGAIGTALQAKAKVQEKANKEALEQNPELDKTKPTETFTDPKSPEFNPEAATVRMSQEVAEAPPEKVEEVKAKHEEVLVNAGIRLDKVESWIEAFQNPDEAPQMIADAKAYVQSQLDADPNADVAEIAAQIVEAEKDLAEFQAEVDNGLTVEDLYKERDILQARLTKALGISSNVEELSPQEDVNPTTIESKILGNPSGLSASDLNKASNNAKYSDADKLTLRALSEARQAYDDLQSIPLVTRDILHGSTATNADTGRPESKSLPSYLEDIGRAVVTGNKHLKANTLRMIKAFDISHATKLDAADKALAISAETGKPQEIIRGEDGAWYVNTGEALKPKDTRKNASLSFDAKSKGSRNLAEAIRQESIAISKTRQAVEQTAEGTVPASKPEDTMQEAQDAESNQDQNLSDIEAVDIEAEAERNKPKSKQGPLEVGIDEEVPFDAYNEEANRTYDNVGDTDYDSSILGESDLNSLDDFETKQGVNKKPQQSKPFKPSSTSATDKVKLPVTGPYTAKDQKKADKATKFIGRGSEASSTTKYAKAFGDKANSSKYSADDVVFISAEGNRKGRKAPDFKEIDKALEANATIITDVASDRERSYNLGEREVADHLVSKGYTEVADGVWKRSQKEPAFKPENNKKISLKYKFRSILANYKNGKEFEAIIEKLLEIQGGNPQIVFSDDPTKLPGESLKDRGYRLDAFADLGSNTIVLVNVESYIKDLKARGIEMTVPEIIAHELAHLVTSTTIFKELSRPRSEVKAEYLGLYNEMKAIQRSIKEALESGKLNGQLQARFEHMFKTPMEIFTIGLVEPLVVQELKTMKATQGNLYQRIVGALSKFFGFTGKDQSLFTSIVHLTETLAQVQRNPSLAATTLPTVETVITPPVEPVVEEVTNDGDSEAEINVEGTGESVDIIEEVVESVSEATKKARELERKEKLADRNLVIDGANRKDNTLLSTIPDTDNFNDIQKAIVNITTEFNSKELSGVVSQRAIVDAAKVLSTIIQGLQNIKTAVLLPKGGKRYHNFAHYLTKDGQLPSEVINALGISTYAWMAENLGAIYKSKKDVGKMVYLPKIENVPAITYKALSRLGTNKNYAAENIGKKAVDLLGYTFLKDVPKDRKDKLAAAIGQIAVNQLISNGTLVETEVSQPALQGYRKAILSVNGSIDVDTSINYGSASFVHGPQTVDGKNLTGLAKKVLDTSKESKSIISKAFGATRNKRLFNLKPTELSQTTIDAIGSEVSSYQLEMVNNAHKNAWNISTDTFTVKQAFSKDAFERMAGVLTDAEIKSQQAMLRDGTKAKNDALKRELATFDEAVSELEVIDAIKAESRGITRNLFLTQEIWKQQRSGMSTGINPVSSKVHRGLLNLKAHKVDLPIDDSIVAIKAGYVDNDAFIKDGVVTKFGEFLQAVALASEDLEPRGVTKTADKTKILNYAPQYAEWVFNEGAPALDALIKVINGNKPTKEDETLIADTVASMGMGMQSLKALTNLARFKEAVDTGKSTFTTDIAIEVDGVTNGPWFTQFLLNTITKAMAAAGGAYTEESGITNVPEYKDAGNDDTYEQNGKLLKKSWNSVKQAYTQANEEYPAQTSQGMLKAVAAMESLYPDMTERAGAKTVTTVINFGSGVKATAQGIIRDFFLATIKQLSKADADSYAEIINHLNDIIKYHNMTSENKTDLIDISVDTNPMEFMFNDAQVTAITKALTIPVQDTVKAFIADNYSAYESVRNKVTAQADFGYGLFERVYKAELAKRLEAIPEDRRDNGELVEGLTAEEHKAFLKDMRKYIPSVPTAMASLSTNTEASSLPLAKVGKGASKDTQHKVSVLMRGNYKYQYISSEFKLVKGVNQKHTHTVNPSISVFQTEEPGVSGLPMYIHSGDGYVAHTQIGTFPSLNVHDAYTAEVGKGRNQTKFANSTVVKLLANTNLVINFAESFFKPLEGLLKTHSDLLSSEATVGEIRKEIATLAISEKLLTYKQVNKEGVRISATALFPTLVQRAYERDIAKLKNLLNFKYINQYGLEGGEYKLTDNDIGMIKHNIQELEVAMMKSLSKVAGLAADLDKALSLNTSEEVTAPESIEVTSEPVIEVDPVSDAVVTAPNALSQYLHNFKTVGNGKFNKNVLFAALAKTINSMNGSTPWADLLAGQIFGYVKAIIPNDIKVEIVPKDLGAATAVGGQNFLAQGQPAWYDSGKNTIYMFEQADGVYQANVLIHELLHAATAVALESADPAVQKAKASIQKVFDAYKKRMESKGELTGGAKYVLKDTKPEHQLDEFIATALTDADMLAELQTIHIPLDGIRKFTTAFKTFMKGVVSILEAMSGIKGTKVPARHLSGVEALVLGVTNLANAYQQNIQGDLLSTPSNKVLGAPKQKAKESVIAMNTLEVLNALTGTGTSFDNSLNNVVSTIANKVFDRFDNALFNSIGLSSDPESVWLDAVAKGEAVAVNKASGAGFVLSERERFATEAIYAAVQAVSKDRSLSLSYAELSKTFNNARSKITPSSFHKGDWNTATKIEKEAAQAKWDHVFKVDANGDHLARFASMSTASEEVHNLLGFKNEEKAPKANTVYDKLLDTLKSVLNHIGLMIIGAKSGQNANNHIVNVLRSLAKVDLKHRNILSGVLESKLNKVDSYIDDKVAKGKEKLAKAVDKSKLSDSKSNVIGITADAVKSAAQDRLWEDLNRSTKMAMESTSGRYGFIRELVNEIGESSPFKNVIESLMRQVKKSSQYKEGLSEATQKNLLNTFHTTLDKVQKAAMSVMLRSDIQSLTTNFNNSQIQKLYSNPQYLSTEIMKYKVIIKNLDTRAPIMHSRAKDLARYMLTGLGAKNNNLAKNAMLIAMGAGTSQRTSSKDVDPNLVAAIDTLVSLYAIQYTDKDTKEALVNLMDKELSHEVNGIDTALRFHKALSEEAKAELFKENPLSVTKGFVPDITNPNHEVRFATTEEEAASLRGQLFREVKVLNPNKLVGGITVRMFISENAGQTRMISGALEVFSQNRKGTNVDLLGNHVGVAKAVMSTANSMRDTKYDPFANADSSAMIPQYDLDGNITGFSYEMAGATRDALLQRNNDFSQLLGQYAATNYNKMNVPFYNEQVVDALTAHASKAYKKSPKSFINVSPTSSDPEVVKMWATLPQATRDYIRKTTGHSSLLVPKDVMLAVFGYQKYSVMDALDKAKGNRNAYEKIYIGVFQALFGKNARVYGSRVERGMQEAVGLAKNMIVIRNVRTLVMNILSNTFLLQAHGASISDIIKDTVVSLRAGMQYRKDSALLLSAQQRLAAGVGNTAKLEQEVLQLEQAIANNPLIDFINEGMMPSIVDDVALKAQDDYSYQSALGRKLDKQLSKIPKPLMEAGKWLMVDPSTPLYEFLNNTTQLSDFTAKYVMYNYYTKNADQKHRLNHADAIQTASDNFINYDMPTSKGMQYLNDMGIVMFTKYNLRIQKALFKLLEKRPARALMQALIMHHGTDIPFGIDPIVWNQIGFPLRDGALILPDALGEPIPVNMLGSLL